MDKEFNLNEKRKQTREDINYLFSKIDFGKSFLDSKAITIMNEFWKDIIEADKEFIEELKENLMIKQENPTEMIDEYNKEMFDKIDKLAGDKEK